ncbi:MAG: peptidyl-prolyl cis-trans isomerase [Bacteroidales bacterium]|jgi:peptidyl-prolyl cis-trans isomerase D|nr:peptidyl-prolyl cis-trans isomerase [Bacteroidales bacterium]MDN5328357.1 peptidyl-prolyl cis-trans isomerase [Bacteroidales bacterium]
MAILGDIRKKSGLAVIFVGVAITAFVLGDIGKSTWRTPTAVGVVGDEEISFQDFEKKVEQNIQYTKMSSQKENLTSEEIFSIRQNTWNQVLNEMIMTKAYKDNGLVIAVDELTDLIQGPNPHKYIVQNFRNPETNQLDRERLIQFFQNLDKLEPDVQKQVQDLIEAVKEERLNAKYNAMIGKAFYMPKALVQKDYQLKNIKASFDYVAQSFTTVPDSLVKVTNKDLKEFYEKNKKSYEQEETRDIDYVIFDVNPSEEDRKAAEQEINKLYADMAVASNIINFVNFNSEDKYDSSWKKQGNLPVQIDSLMFNSAVNTMAGPWIDNNTYYIARLMDVQSRPDSLKASHILIAYKNAYGASQKTTRSKEAAKKTADSLASIIKANKNKLAEIAASISDDPSAKTNNGDLGWFADGQMVPSFNEAVRKGNVGDVTVAESPFGYHVIHVTGKTKPIKKVRVAIVKKSIQPSTVTMQKVYAEASKFAGENRTREAFDKAVAELGLNKRTKDYMSPMEMSLPGIDNSREIIRWAYSKDVKPGDVSDVKEFENKFVVAVLKKIRPKGLTPLEDIKQALEATVMKKKKLEYLAAKMKEVNTKSLTELATRLNARVDTVSDITFYTYNIPGLGREPEITGTIFSLNPNEVSEPIIGLNYTVVVKVKNFSDAPAKTDFTFERKQLENNFFARTSTSAYKALEKRANVKDNRFLFY